MSNTIKPIIFDLNDVEKKRKMAINLHTIF